MGSLSGTDGVQLYAVNQAPSLAPPTAARAAVYFGVFSRGSMGNPGSPTSPGTYDFRLRPASGINCSSLHNRPANDAPWGATPAPTTSATSLLLARQSYRAEYIEAGFRVSLVPATITGDSLLCPGGSLTLTAAAAGAQSYRWNTGATTPTITVAQPGTYTVVATLATGCTVSAQRVVLPRQTLVRIVGDSLLCPGRTLPLSAQAQGAATYRWNTGATTAALAVTQAGTYTVTVTFPGGCTASRQLTVRASLAAPAFSLGADTTICEGGAVLLSAPAGGYTYQWSDGTTARTLLVSAAGTYSVQVRSGCNEQTARRTLNTQFCIPNIITPNRDGKNDTFVVGAGPPANSPLGDWSLTIYNRWGKEVYQTTRYRDDWGGDATAGTYFYLLRRPSTNTVLKGWLQVMN